MRVLTGIQPSGKLHWGNYFGAMKSMFDLQAKGEDMFMFIANFHAMTTVRDGAVLREATREVALDYLACGLDPAKTTVYRQSDVPEVQELAWYLSCLTPMGLLERCHSYKDKMAHGFEATHGLFAYPVLMAADILIMQSDLVPVGKDQKQHLEVTRDIARHLAQCRPVAHGCHGMVVCDEHEDLLALRLKVEHRLHRAEIVAPVQFARGLDAGKNTHVSC